MFVASASGGSSVAGVALLMLFVVMGFTLYFLPAIVAQRRTHHQFTSILVINIFLGWTFIGWIAALAMSLSATSGVGTPMAPARGQSAASAASAPVGWYADPDDPGQLRLWDGAGWTDSVKQVG